MTVYRYGGSKNLYFSSNWSISLEKHDKEIMMNCLTKKLKIVVHASLEWCNKVIIVNDSFLTSWKHLYTGIPLGPYAQKKIHN